MAKLAEVATHLDLSLARVSQLKSAGILPDAKRGKHDLDTVRVAYIRHLRENAAGRSPAYGTLDLTAARARLAAGKGPLHAVLLVRRPLPVEVEPAVVGGPVRAGTVNRVKVP